MQELDAERRAAILRGRTPPPLPADDAQDADRKLSRHGPHDRKRRKLRGEDDTDMDIRLAASLAKPAEGAEEDAKLLKLRKPTSDAPLTDHAGNIDLFPVDIKEALKREKNADAEKEKRKKEQTFEDQYTMRFSNARGKNSFEQPWYTVQQNDAPAASHDTAVLEYPAIENKNVWGNQDPRRKEREQARISSSDPFAFMQQAQTQLKRSKEDRKKWADERGRELKELRDVQEKEERRSKHHRKSSRRRSRSRSRSPNRERRRNRDRSRSPIRHQHGRHDRSRHSSSRHHTSQSLSSGRREYAKEHIPA